MIDSMVSPGETAALDDDVVWEILLRLPSASVLRSRAVCRAWRRITTDRLFLTALADRQPAELLVMAGGWPHHEAALDTIPLSLQVGDDHQLTRRLQLPNYCDVERLVFSCDGLLLFEELLAWKYNSNLFMVCNPVTRQGAWLDVMPPACRGNLALLCGFYSHGPSGEHRLLVLANEHQRLTRYYQPYYLVDEDNSSAAHYVFSAASMSSRPPRRLGPVAGNVVVQPYNHVLKHCVNYRGKLHWTEHPLAMSARKILAFDTVSEAFRHIPFPPRWPGDNYFCCDWDDYLGLSLLELDGSLAVTVTIDTCPHSMELYVLENYDDDGSWTHRLRINLPSLFDARWAIGVPGFPDVILVAAALQDDEILVAFSSAALYHLKEKRIIKRMKFVSAKPGCHFVFKDSLVSYDFFHPY